MKTSRAGSLSWIFYLNCALLYHLSSIYIGSFEIKEHIKIVEQVPFSAISYTSPFEKKVIILPFACDHFSHAVATPYLASDHF